ncbi:M23 family metallopeptidase [Nocardia sp. NPDC051463]|uniref:M23 family metallopeptidase n=1 Tax=Nocardia sp. NPDC051463 TaxID=3154845 RepID=UPI00344D6229
MNHRSTLPSSHRVRSGHRYRPDDEPFDGYADQSRRDAPAADARYAAPAAGAHAGYEFQPAGDHRDDSWSANDAWSQQEWSQQDSWSDGGAWSAEEAWAPAADNSWTPETHNTWTPETNNTWTPETGDAWTPPADDSWTPDTGDSWAADADDSWEHEHEAEAVESRAVPTVIPGRRSQRRGGAHRVPAPPTALKGRAAVVAVAAGAVVAAGQAAFAAPEQPSATVDYEAAGQIHEIAAQSMSVTDPTAAPDSPQVLNVSAPSNLGQFNDILQKGQKYAEDLAAEEAAKLRPLFTKFAAGNFTSGYGARWGVQHLGIDIAGPIGTPIVAVADGTVIEAGPASGFGMWVRLLHDDGTVTIYGHIDTATVSQGQRVLAGDQIATIGNRGFSTGPHCHFEVWLNGHDKIDPLPWLATRGISLGQQRD